MRKLLILFAAFGMRVRLRSPGEDDGGFDFQAGISLGTDVLIDSPGNPETWNSLGFQPDLSFGNFGIGFDLTIQLQADAHY